MGLAKSMMQGWTASAPSRPQSFSVSCAEGHRLHGQRTEGYQALRCPTCGEGIFVLPRSPLPEPPVPASARRSRVEAVVEAFPEDEPLVLTDPIPSASMATDDDLPEAEINWEDAAGTDPEPQPQTAQSRRPALAPALAPTSAPARKTSGPKARPKPVAPELPEVERPTVREWATAHRNGLLVAGLLVLVVGTVAFRRHRQRLEEYPRVVELGRTEGLKKLDAGEFHAAKKILGDAADAVNALGGRVEGAETIRQGALEAAIFADLAPKGMDEILEEAATGDSKDWPSRFAALYKGRSVILDPPVSGVPDAAKSGEAYQVTCPIYFGRGPRFDGKGRVDLAGFRLFELAQPKLDEQKPFGARYASIELDLTSNEWVVTFEPDSGVFISHTKALEAIDWAPGDPAEEPGP